MVNLHHFCYNLKYRCKNYGINIDYFYKFQNFLDNIGINVTHPCFKIFTPLHYACSEGNYKMVERLLLENNLDPNELDEFYRSPLFIACDHGYANIVKILLDKGADIKFKYYNHCNLLNEACCRGHYETIKILLDYCKDYDFVNFKDKYNNTALSIAIFYEHLDIVKLLVEEGNADIKLVNYNTRNLEIINYIKNHKRDWLSKEIFDNNIICSICHEDNKNNIHMIKTPCNHIYCKKCLEEWLKLKEICPYCRQNL
jgi:ankyrin repeat protein